MDELERRIFRLEKDGDELVVEVGAGGVASSEVLAVGVLAERAPDGSLVRLRLSGLKQSSTTNAWLSPMVRCKDDGPVSGRDGTTVYMLALSPNERADRVFHEAKGNDARSD